MEHHLNKAVLFLKLALISIFLSALQVVWVPFVSYGDSLWGNITSFTISGCLWVFFIAGYVLFYFSRHHFKLAHQKSGVRRLRRDKLKVGIFNLFTNLEAAVFDIVAIVSLIATIVTSIFLKSVPFAISTSAALFIFSIQMHCILNGKVYNDMRTLEARRMKNE